MHDYNTIVGVISLRNDKVSYPVIRQRYGIGRVCESFSVNRIFRSSMIKYKIIGDLILWQEKRNRYTKYK